MQWETGITIKLENAVGPDAGGRPEHDKEDHERAAALNLSLLGGFRASVDHQPITRFGYDKVRALLAYLAVEAGPHRRDFLAECFWPYQSQQRARQSLRQALAWLRWSLGDQARSQPFLVASRHTVRLNPDRDVRVDIAPFLAAAPVCDAGDTLVRVACRRWHEAVVRRYRGPFLADLDLDASPEFIEWRESRRHQFHCRLLDSLYHLAECYASTGDFQTALGYARRQLALEPWREPAHRQAMSLLARTNNRLAALAQFEECRAVLQTELGVEPDQQTLALYGVIRDTGKGGDHPTAAVPPLGRREVGTGVPVRRQVTALHCGVVEGMELDPEELESVCARFQAYCTQLIARSSGYIAQQRPGQLLVYFGLPEAREDAAQQAVDTALELLRRRPDDLALRVGVDAGVALVSRGDRDAELMVAGSVAGVAHQLHELAARNTVVLSPAAYRLVRAAVITRPLGRHKLRDCANELALYEALGARPAQDAPQTLPVFGRQAESERLRGHLDCALDGTAGGVLITGEAGMGKTHLVGALRRASADTGRIWHEFAFVPDDISTPLAGLCRCLRRLLAADAGEETLTPHGARDALGRLGVASGPQHAALIAMLTGPDHGTDVSSGIGGEAVLRDVFLLWLKQEPHGCRVLVLEDLHWADSASLAILTGCIAECEQQGLLVIGTLRPTCHVPFLGELALDKLALGHLSQPALRELVDWVAAGQLDHNVRGEIVRHSDGVPWFAEELTRLAVSRGGDNVRAGPGEGPTVPARIRDYLESRLQNLGEDLDIIQLAAILGRDVDLCLLRAMIASQGMAQDACAIDEAVQRLVGADYWELNNQPERKAIRFRFWLEWQHAYYSQIRRVRTSIHENALELLSGSHSGLAVTDSAQLAWHHQAAGRTGGAVACWLAAGRQDLAQNRSDQAWLAFRQGIELCETLRRDDDTLAQLMELHAGLAAVYRLREGPESPAAFSHSREALRHMEQLTGSEAYARVLFGCWQGALRRGDVVEAAMLAGQINQIGVHETGFALASASRHVQAVTALWTGDFGQAHPKIWCDAEDGLAAPEGGVGDVYPQTLVRVHAALAHWLHGAPDYATADAAKAVAEAHFAGNAASEVWARTFAAMIRQLRDQPELARCEAERAGELARRHGLACWEPLTRMIRGWALMALGRMRAGIVLIEEGRAVLDACGPGLLAGYACLLRGRAWLLRKPHPDLLKMLESQIRQDRKRGIGCFAVELMTVRAEVLAALARVADANRAFGAALLRAEASRSRAQVWRVFTRAVAVLPDPTTVFCSDRLLSPLAWALEEPDRGPDPTGCRPQDDSLEKTTRQLACKQAR